MTVRRAGTSVRVFLLGLVAIGGMAHAFAATVPEPPDPLPGGGTCVPQPPPLPDSNSPACTSHQFAHKVLAYHMAEKPVTAPVPWAHLTNFSDFAVAATATGALTGAYGFNFCDLQTLVTAGHGQCVRVGVTLVAEPNANDTAFKDNIHAFLTSATARANLIANLVGNLYYANADGVDVDIEFPRTCNTNSPPGCIDDGQAYVSFVAELATQVHAWKPGAYVYVAVPQWDWAGLQSRYWDLANVSDGIQIMGYGYHSVGPTGTTAPEFSPGPISPIHGGSGTVWPPIGTAPDDLNKTFEYYRTTLGIPPSKLLMGYPFYGHEFPTTTSTIPSLYDWNSAESWWFRNLANPAAATDCDRQFAIGKQWDAGSKTPYRIFQGTYGPRQLFCEDVTSLTNKLDLATCKGAAGSFYWAENFITADHPFWTVVDQRVKLPVAVPPTDSDGDGVADECDNCPTIANANQYDCNDNGKGDVCDVWCSKPLKSIATEDGEIKSGSNPSATSTTMRISSTGPYRSVISFYSPLDTATPASQQLPPGAIIKGAILSLVEDPAMSGTQPAVSAWIKQVAAGSGAFSTNNALQKTDYTDTTAVTQITGTFSPVTPGPGLASQLAFTQAQLPLLDRTSSKTARIQFRLQTAGTGTARWLTGNYTTNPVAQPTLELLYSAP